MRNKATKAWHDTWQWLGNTKSGQIVGVVVVGIISAIFVGESIWQRAFAGFLGAVIALLVIVAITYIVHLLWITPKRQEKEDRDKFIREHATYAKQFLGNSTKQKYLEILDTLRSLINIENTVADNMFGTHSMTDYELAIFQRKMKEQVKGFSLIKPLKRYSPEIFVKAVEKGIRKLNLKPIGETPTEMQTELMIKGRIVLDDMGLGLSKVLGEHDEYKAWLQKLNEQVSELDKIPDWIIWCSAIPLGLNSAYLFYSYLPQQARQTLSSHRPELTEFQSKRALAIQDMVNDCQKIINGELQDNGD